MSAAAVLSEWPSHGVGRAAQLVLRAVIAPPREHLQGAAETESPLCGGQGSPRDCHLARGILHMTGVFAPYPPSERWRGL